jgi:hypothetical protein
MAVARPSNKSKKKTKSIEIDPPGRPSKYKPEYCQDLKDHMKAGFTFESFAAEADVCEDTLYEWKKVHPDFAYAHKCGIPKRRKRFEEQNLNYIEAGQSNSNLIFTLKTQFGWYEPKPEAPRDGEHGPSEELEILKAQFKAILEGK